MRILLLDQFSDPGGAQHCLGDLFSEVEKRGWDAELLAPGDGFLHHRARECGIKTHTLPLREYENGCKSAADVCKFVVDVARGRQQVKRLATQQPTDVLYVNGPRVLPMVTRLGIPILFHSHSVLDKVYSRWIARLCLDSKETLVVAGSEFLALQLRRLLGGGCVQVIYNGVEDLGFAPGRGRASGLRIGIVGRIAPEKGQLEFLQAAQLLSLQGELQFVVVGSGLISAPGYEHSVQEMGRCLGVEFRGWVGDPAEIYRDLDILVVPSAPHDANPRVIMEAMSAGVCVIAFPSGGIPELIQNGRDGLIVERTPDVLANGILLLAENGRLREQFQRNGRITFESRFTLQRFRLEVCSAIEALVRSCARDTNEYSFWRTKAVSARDGSPSRR